MLFNSIEFAFFLPVVFLGYWYVCSRRKSWQNVFLLAVSYIFYGWWDWRFLSLIIISSVTDYVLGLMIYRTEVHGRRKVLLVVSLIVNLGILGFFKYYNFFVDSFVEVLMTVGVRSSLRTLNVILPVGISFYTFQTLSYTIDIYRGKLQPTRDMAAFFAFVAFFPQLVAGPIERASNLLKQFEVKRQFNYCQAIDGLRQMLWGLFKKVVIADSCAVNVDMIFAQPEGQAGSVLLLGAIYFSFQIYADFSGYSDMAIGVARLFGITLSRNFANPYFSRNMPEFWRRWHISLSSWFRDYLYISLGGSRCGKVREVFNILLTFVVSGLWHGANLTFLLWGLFHAICYMPSVLFGLGRRKASASKQSSVVLRCILAVVSCLVTYALVVVGWVLFRAETVHQACVYYGGLFFEKLVQYA